MSTLLALTLIVALAASVLVVLTTRWHGRFSMDLTAGVQKFHTLPTPRIGGVAIVAGLLAGWSVAPPSVNALLTPLLFAGVPAFAAGLLEDITKKVGVMARLLATMMSGGLACWLTGIALNRVDIPLVDLVLAWAPAAVLFTAFAVAGVANAINIIDGFNGLSSGSVLIILAALGTIAGLEGDVALATTVGMLGAAVLGFWCVNFPFGKLFLGDGGAYFVGFALAWLCVLLVMRNPSVSPWAVLLACTYPVTEVLYSVWRRLRLKQPAGAPDSLHLHSLVKTQLIRRLVPHWAAPLRNAAVSPIMWLFGTLPAVLAVWTENLPSPVVAGALALCVLLYHLFYRSLARRADAQHALLRARPHETARHTLPLRHTAHPRTSRDGDSPAQSGPAC